MMRFRDQDSFRIPVLNPNEYCTHVQFSLTTNRYGNKTCWYLHANPVVIKDGMVSFICYIGPDEDSWRGSFMELLSAGRKSKGADAKARVLADEHMPEMMKRMTDQGIVFKEECQ